VARITKRYVDGLRPTAADTVYWDDDLTGFGVRVRPSGGKSYVFRYRLGGGRSGRLRKLTLGPIGSYTPEQARKAAQDANALVRTGKDPAGDKRAQRLDLTIAKLVEHYLEEGPADKPDKKASSWATDASNLRRHVVPLLGRRHLATITRTDVQRFQADVTAGKTKAPDAPSGRKRGTVRVRGGAGTAWRATAVLSAMLGWATDRGLRETNPAEGVQLNKLASRERYLTDHEVGRLGEAMASLEAKGGNPTSLAIIRLLLLTGCRRNEIASAKWQHVDFQRGALLLPDSKTGQKTVPLGAPALAVFSTLPRDNRSEYVFPAARGTGFNVGVAKVWRVLREEAGLKGVRLHDLRHSFASVGVSLNQSLFIVGKVLGHTRAQTTEKYSHLALDPVRAAAEQTSQRLAGALRGRKSSNVVRMKRARK
jgi:integrase